MPTPASENGASTQCPDPASPATTPGKAIPGRLAGRLPGLPVPTIPKPINCSGQPAILRLLIVVKAASVTTCTAIRFLLLTPTREGRRVCPGAAGTTNWMSPTFDSQTGLFYVNAREQCDIFSTAPQPYEAGHAYYGSAYFPADDTEPYWGALRAIDPATGKIKWEFPHPSPSWSGVLSTAGGLVFTGDAEGNFIALDAASGKPLWHFQTGGAVYAAPITFALDRKQYIAIAAGSSLYTFSLP